MEVENRILYLKNLSGLLFASIYIFARALCVAGSSLPSCIRDSSHGNSNFNRFRFSTSATNSSVENCPFTESIKLFITSSAQSTSNKPPTTIDKRAGFT